MSEGENTTGCGSDTESKPVKHRSTKRGKSTRRLTFAEKQQAITMVTQGMPVATAARAIDCTPQAVYKVLQDFEHLLPELQNVAQFRKDRPDIIDAAQRKVLKYATKDEVLAKATANNLGYLYRQLFDSGRLERGLSTSNASTVVRFTTIPDLPTTKDDDSA